MALTGCSVPEGSHLWLLGVEGLGLAPGAGGWLLLSPEVMAESRA